MEKNYFGKVKLQTVIPIHSFMNKAICLLEVVLEGIKAITTVAQATVVEKVCLEGFACPSGQS